MVGGEKGVLAVLSKQIGNLRGIAAVNNTGGAPWGRMKRELKGIDTQAERRNDWRRNVEA